jgi:hypothetical protein
MSLNLSPVCEERKIENERILDGYYSIEPDTGKKFCSVKQLHTFLSERTERGLYWHKSHTFCAFTANKKSLDYIDDTDSIKGFKNSLKLNDEMKFYVDNFMFYGA